MKKWIILGCLVVLSLLMAVAPHLSMSIEAPVRPVMEDIAGYIYQIIARSFASYSADTLTSALVFLACFVLAKRNLFRKPKSAGFGEYFLCLFFTCCMLASNAMRAEGTLFALYANFFQLIKLAVLSCGYFSLYLCALRELERLLRRGHHMLPSCKISFWDRHPFGFPALVLLCFWLIHIIGKYPGVIHHDFL